MPFDNRELHLCNVQIQRRRSIAKTLLDDRSLAEVHVSKLTVLEKSRDKTQQKLDEITGGSAFASIKHGMIFNRSGKTDELRAAIATLTAEHRDAVDKLQVISKRIADAEAELLAIKGCEERYQTLLREKKEYIIAIAEPESELLMQMDRELQAVEMKSRALDKALQSGVQTRDHLKRLVADTGNARPGSHPVLVEGTISVASRNSSSAAARNLFPKTMDLVRQFTRDLSSLNVRVNVSMNFESRFFAPRRTVLSLETGSDIDHAYDEVCRTRDDVNLALEKLNALQEEITRKKVELHQKIEELLLNTIL